MFVPATPSAPSRRSKELARELDATIADYRKREPRISNQEVREAMSLAMPSGGRQQLVVALALGVVLLIAGLVFFVTEQGGEGLPPITMAIGIVAIAFVFVLIKVFAGRNQ